MANRHRGEINASLNGKEYRLCLTLGALAELEDAFGADDMVALAQRFEQGRMRANDAVRIIGAGLRGAGNDIRDEDVRSMQADGGAGGYIDIVARLLRATFADGEEADAPRDSAEPHEVETAPGPFPGKT
ncbi:MAG: gene transfer agent family protein [Filomicrobium sp.]